MTVYWLLLGMLCSLALCLPGLAFAQPEDSATPSAGDLVAGSILVAQEGEGGQAAVSYTYDAQQYKPGENAYPGVYAVKVNANTAAETIGISRIADKTLAEAPTLESPAIICGGAVGYETIEHVRAFEAPNDQRVAPYSYFKYSILDEVAQDGSHHKKLSGFDGTYVIVRIDVSELFANLPSGVSSEDAVLHVKQEKNNALLVAVGQEGDKTNYNTFSNIVAQSDGSNVQVKVGAYKLGAMKDSGANDPDKATPYFDVILFSTASIVSGADAQKEGALNGDVDLSFYIDSATDYTPDAPAYDPTKTFTDPNEEKAYIQSFYDRFYDESKATAAGAAISHYTVKGSDLALETMVEKSGGDNKDAGTTYWSLEKSLQKPYYNLPADNSATDSGCGRTVKLMSEVPIIDNLALEGASDTQLKKRTLDVNSFDIQVANNKTESPGEYKSGLAVKNAWLKIEDLSNTTGAELAIGNNATLTIDSGGKLIVVGELGVGARLE